MPHKSLKIKQIVKKNKSVDAAALVGALKVIGDLRSTGMTGPAYRLDSVFDRRISPSPEQTTKAEERPELSYRAR